MFSLYDIPLLTELVLGVARFIYKHIAPTGAEKRIADLSDTLLIDGRRPKTAAWEATAA